MKKFILIIPLVTLILFSCKQEVKKTDPNKPLIAEFRGDIQKNINLIEMDIYTKGVPEKYKVNGKLSTDAIATAAAANILNYRAKVFDTEDCIKKLVKDSTYNYALDSTKMVIIEQHFDNLNRTLERIDNNKSFMINSERIDLLREYLNDICASVPKIVY